MYKKATASQRLFAFLIDIIVLGTILYLISLIVGLFISIPEMPQVVYDYYFSNSNVYDPNEYDILISNPIVTEYFNQVFKFYVTYIVIILSMFIGYFVCIAYFWEHQTIGRLSMKIKVVYQNNKPTFGTVILREIIGVLLIGTLGMCCCCIPGIVNVVLMFGTSSTTIHDRIANTEIVISDSFEPIIEDDSDNFFKKEEIEIVYTDNNNNE